MRCLFYFVFVILYFLLHTNLMVGKHERKYKNWFTPIHPPLITLCNSIIGIRVRLAFDQTNHRKSTMLKGEEVGSFRAIEFKRWTWLWHQRVPPRIGWLQPMEIMNEDFFTDQHWGQLRIGLPWGRALKLLRTRIEESLARKSGLRNKFWGKQQGNEIIN